MLEGGGVRVAVAGSWGVSLRFCFFAGDIGARFVGMLVFIVAICALFSDMYCTYAMSSARSTTTASASSKMKLEHQANVK